MSARSALWIISIWARWFIRMSGPEPKWNVALNFLWILILFNNYKYALLKDCISVMSLYNIYPFIYWNIIFINPYLDKILSVIIHIWMNNYRFRLLICAIFVSNRKHYCHEYLLSTVFQKWTGKLTKQKKALLSNLWSVFDPTTDSNLGTMPIFDNNSGILG